MEYDFEVEQLLIEADRRALRLLSPATRSFIILLRSLHRRGKEIEDIRVECTAMGLTCKGLEAAIKRLLSYGLIETKDNEIKLTEHGLELSLALNDVIDKLRDFAYKAVRGDIDEVEAYTHLVTPAASIIGVVESFYEEPSVFDLALRVHGYVSLLIASVLALLVRRSPKLLHVLEKMF